jgi:hypothetical protein
MGRWAIVENNIVVNIIMADQDFIDNQGLEGINIDDEPYAGIGMSVVGGEVVIPSGGE